MRPSNGRKRNRRILMRHWLHPFVALCAGAGLSGCGVTSQLHSELNYGAAGSGTLVDGESIGALTPAAPTGRVTKSSPLRARA
jgi:hypothetical protein